jgi:hypothetical protein
MGSVKISRLSDAEICERYRDGECRTMLALRAKVPDYRITEILTAHGVRLRGPNEALRLALKQRRALALKQQSRGRG